MEAVEVAVRAAGAILEIANDDTFNDYSLPSHRGGGAVTLNIMDLIFGGASGKLTAIHFFAGREQRPTRAGSDGMFDKRVSPRYVWVARQGLIVAAFRAVCVTCHIHRAVVQRDGIAGVVQS